MTEDTPLDTGPRCEVTFTKSSSRDGGSGYSVRVRQGCTLKEADTTFDIAFMLKAKADAVLAGKPLIETLEKSLKETEHG